MEQFNNNIRLIIARHCQTILNVTDRYQGIKYDYPLTDTGLAQAANLGKALDPYFEQTPIDKVFVSDTLRARQTAYIVTNGMEDFVVDKRLNPFDLGAADGKREDEMFTLFRFPLLAKGKENFAKYLKRIRCFLADTIKENIGKTVLVVTHEDITGVMESYLSNLFILKAPSSGLANGTARIYDIIVNDKIKLTNKHNFGKLNTSCQNITNAEYEK